MRCIRVAVAVFLPFFALGPVQAQDLALGEVTCGTGGTIAFNVFNIGNATAGQHRVQINDASGRVVSNLAIQRPINPGGANPVSWQLRTTPGLAPWPNQTYRVTVDPAVSVADINRRNNALDVFCPGGRTAGVLARPTRSTTAFIRPPPSIPTPSPTPTPSPIPTPASPPGIVISPGGGPSRPTITITTCSPSFVVLGICTPTTGTPLPPTIGGPPPGRPGIVFRPLPPRSLPPVSVAPFYRCTRLIATPHRFPDDLAWDGNNLWGVNLEAANSVTMTDTVAPRYLARYDSIRTVRGRLINMNTVISTADRPNAGMGLTGLTWDGTYLWLTHYWLITHPDKQRLGQTIYLWQLQPQRGPRGTLVLQEISSIEFQPWKSQQGRPRGLAWDPARRTLWASDDAPGNNRGQGWIYNIDPRSGGVLARFPAPTELPSGLTWAPEGLWAATYDQGNPRYWLLNPNQGPNRRDPASAGVAITSQSACAAGPTGLAFDGAPWAADEGPNALFRLR